MLFIRLNQRAIRKAQLIDRALALRIYPGDGGSSTWRQNLFAKLEIAHSLGSGGRPDYCIKRLGFAGLCRCLNQRIAGRIAIAILGLEYRLTLLWIHPRALIGDPLD